ncbi:MAG: 5-(carboxyamino)imidazole ribonucleotide mutase [Nanoarchaeota archaeon]|nr:5-(carboxyamino)imidazole ribonucleotide mutase [Nanoarchaeota archaeon]
MKIEVRVGSDSDLPKIKNSFTTLDNLSIPYSVRILSAHRTPDAMSENARNLVKDGFKVSIGAAGGSAHLPGMTSSETSLPVIALPVKTSFFDGMDSLHSMIQMPPGVPVGCVGSGNAEGAAILAAQIAYLNDPEVRKRICDYRHIPYREIVFKPRVALINSSPSLEKDADASIKLLSSFGVECYKFEWGEKILEDLINKGCVAIIAVNPYPGKPLAGELSMKTDLPVIVVPCSSENSLSIFSDILGTYPLAGQGINRLMNGAIFAAKVLGANDEQVRIKVEEYSKGLAQEVKEKDKILVETGISAYLDKMGMKENGK